MSLAALSLAALLVAVLVSCVSEINIGVLAIALAWGVGVLAGMTPAQVMAGFPVQVFMTLVGVTLLFGLAQANGTLDRITRRAVRLCRGNRALVPLLFFAMALVLSSIGPGNIASAALMVPLAMGAAHQAAINPLLMSIMVGNGASAGSLSPFAPAGVIVNGIMSEWGLSRVVAYNYVNNVTVHTIVALLGYLLLGGVRLWKPARVVSTIDADTAATSSVDAPPSFDARHLWTMGVIGALIVSVVVFDAHVGLGAFVAAAVLTLVRASDERAALSRMPWGVIVMVSGVSLLVAMLEKTGGTDLGAAWLARVSTPLSVAGVAGFVSGAVSIFSSTSGVVLPALIPLVPGLVQRVGGDNLLGVASAINVTGHLVDVSPLSTIGALCLAAAPPGTDTRRLFYSLLAWGASMSVIGAAICWILFGVLRIP